jgi:hypothetical protein
MVAQLTQNLAAPPWERRCVQEAFTSVAGAVVRGITNCVMIPYLI